MLGRNGPRPSSRRVNAPSVDVGREAFDVVGSCLCGHEKRSAAQRQPLLQPLAVQWFVTPITIACNPFRSQRGTGLLLRQNSSHRARDAGCHGRGSVPRPRRTPVVWSDNVRDRDAVTLGKVCSTSPAAGTRACLRARRRIPWIRVPPQVKCSRSARSPSCVRCHPRRSGTQRGLRTQRLRATSSARTRSRHLCQLMSRDMGTCGLFMHYLASARPKSRT